MEDKERENLDGYFGLQMIKVIDQRFIYFISSTLLYAFYPTFMSFFFKSNQKKGLIIGAFVYMN